MSVYFIQKGEDGPVKIGYSANPKSRLAALRTASDIPLRLIATVEGDRSAEYELHARFASARLEGEWFSPTEEILAYADSVAPQAPLAAIPAAPQESPEDFHARWMADPERFFDLLSKLPDSTLNLIIEIAAENHKASVALAFRQRLGRP